MVEQQTIEEITRKEEICYKDEALFSEQELAYFTRSFSKSLLAARLSNNNVRDIRKRTESMNFVSLPFMKKQEVSQRDSGKFFDVLMQEKFIGIKYKSGSFGIVFPRRVVTGGYSLDTYLTVEPRTIERERELVYLHEIESVVLYRNKESELLEKNKVNYIEYDLSGWEAKPRVVQSSYKDSIN